VGGDEKNRRFEEGRKVGLREGRELGLAEGREIGRREGIGFTSIQPLSLVHRGASFEFNRSWVESFIDYERDLTECLHAILQRRWMVGEDAREAESDLLVGAQEEIKRELARVRRAVDAEVDRGLGRERILEALRGPPGRPPGVREYRTIESFVDGDRRRGVFDWPRRRDAAGSDWGHWSLERPIRRWETTSWRVSWLGHDDATNELYALEFAVRSSGERGPRRVWLLGSVANWSEVDALITPLSGVARERNSLIAVANAVSAADHRAHPHSEENL
jgi:hypothetical protein